MVEIDELVEKAARAICCPDGKCASETKPHGWLVPQPCNAVIYRAEARAVIPLIEAAAFERAAGVADKEDLHAGGAAAVAETSAQRVHLLAVRDTAIRIATAIRSLTEKQNGPV